MANYRSLVGGSFSKDPFNLNEKRSIRANNPWALNISDWQRTYPGFVGTTQADNSPNANKTTIYETPEQGIAAGVTLLGKYAAGGFDTVGEIINRYGGGQDYSSYLEFVVKQTGWTANTLINLRDDQQVLKLAKAMFRYEAGKQIPWTDQQILYGIALSRQYAGGPAAPAAAPRPQVPVATTTVKPTGGFWATLFAALVSMLGGTKLPSGRELKMGDRSPKGGDVWKLQEKLRDIGFVDVVVDGEFGGVTDKAIRVFQERENLDPDGEVGVLTREALNRAKPGQAHKPDLLPPPVVSNGTPNIKPDWYKEAEKDIGWKEIGNNANIEYFLKDGKPRVGQKGEPYCAHAINAWLGRAGLMGSGSGMARSFERSDRFIWLDKPVLGCICTMWRTSKASGQGHVYLYDGESPKGIRGIGANEDDTVKRSFHDRSRWTGYWWPKAVPLPSGGGPILVSDGGSVVARSET